MSKINFCKRNGTCITILCCLAALINLVLPVQAATGVPGEVMDAVESVVYIAHLVEAECVDAEYLAEVRKEAPEYIFEIRGKEYVWNGSGSGFVIKNENGEVLIATNNHVVEDDFDDIFVWLTKDKIAHAEVVFAVPEKDLSVIRIREITNKKPVPLAAEDAQRGEAVYAVGFPGAANDIADGIACTSDEAVITDGIISTVRSSTMEYGAESTKLLLMNVSINHGNSGGPLFDSQGNVVGINTLGVENTNGAIAVSELRSLLGEYGIEIPTAAEPEETVPAEPETTVSTVPKLGDPVKSPRERNIAPMIFAGVAVVCAVVLMVVLQKEKNNRKEKISREKKDVKKEQQEDPSFKPIVLKEDTDISMTHGHRTNHGNSETQENNQDVSDYMKQIKPLE